MNTEATLESIYEAHAHELARLKADYARELNAKLEQINKQAETIKDERQRREQVERDLTCFIHNGNELHNKYLSALAAIGKHNDQFNIGSSFRINIDL